MIQGDGFDSCAGAGALNAPAVPAPLPEAEEWRPVPGSDGLYSVSSLGRARSEPIAASRSGRQRGRILRCHRDSKGYLQFQICLLGGRSIRMKLHRAVALAFMGPRPAGAQINHKSGDKRDNSVANLEYVTCRENIRHGWKIGLYHGDHARGERNCRARLTSCEVRAIRELGLTAGPTALARRFGVSKSTVWQVLQGKTWKHVA
jgi:hypothetical protein